MTRDMNWTNIQIDHVKPICLFDVSKNDELRESLCWKNTQPLHKRDHQHMGTKFKFLAYQLQFIKAFQLLKLNEEGLNQDFLVMR